MFSDRQRWSRPRHPLPAVDQEPRDEQPSSSARLMNNGVNGSVGKPNRQQTDEPMLRGIGHPSRGYLQRRETKLL
jgi:hypothetical protein